MKQILLNTKVSKIYIISVILVTLLLLASYYSYAMFTVSKERNNAISIVTGTLSYDLKVDGVNTNELVVGPNEEKTFSITLSNPNERMARFNFYYVGALPEGVTVGYLVDKNINIPPLAEGLNLEISGSVGASNVYKIIVTNNSNSNITITLGVGVGLDYNDLVLPSNGHLFEEIKLETVADYLLAGVGENGVINTTDPDQTFVTGTDPNNYIWYSGKLWRAVSIDTSDNSVKLVTQWNISAISYNESGNTAFEDSYMEEWLNDTTADGFLGNLREPEKFIKMNSIWNATETTDPSKLNDIILVPAPVGLLNVYEYTMSYSGTEASNGYLNNGLYWWTLTPYDNQNIYDVDNAGDASDGIYPISIYGVRPSVNLKSDINIVSGDGTIDNPYRLEGDNDTALSGTLLNTRYSGEYIRFGIGENNLYRIVSHETIGLTKITSAEPLKQSGNFITSAFGDNVIFSSSNTIGTFLNENYLNTNSGYLSSNDISMIEGNTFWYLGTVGRGMSYIFAKYTDTNMTNTTTSTEANVGILRLGELMAGQFDIYQNNLYYWLLTPYSSSNVLYIGNNGYADLNGYLREDGVKPSLNLKSDIIITTGTGTKDDPFELALS